MDFEKYRELKDGTVVINIRKEGGQYRRQDVISAVKATVGRGKIMGLGQLESNLRWEVVFKDTASKQTYMNSQISVKGVEATTENMQRKPRLLRIQRIPLCVPNMHIASLLTKKGIKVTRIEFERNRLDNLISNTRTVMVDTDDWDDVPDYLPWNFDCLRGVALLFLQGRSPKCHIDVMSEDIDFSNVGIRIVQSVGRLGTPREKNANSRMRIC